MFVTVFLVEAKTHTVIPEEFVFKLVEANLKNHGLNSNQNRLIYFSRELFELLESHVVPRAEIIPNFGLPITEMYPLPDGLLETCFIGRLIKIWGECLHHIYIFFYLGFKTESIIFLNIRIFRRCTRTCHWIATIFATYIQYCT